MLREVKPAMHAEDVFFIFNDVLYSESEFWAEARILVDEPEEDEIEIVDFEEDEEVEEVEEEEEPEPEKPKSRRGGSRRSKKEEILAAWNGGERTAEEVAEIVGCSLQTVRKYI